MIANKGRKKIYTDEREITLENVRAVVREAMTTHEVNRMDIEQLYKIEKNDMSLSRVKDIRPEIDTQAITPYPSLITDFKLGYENGEPINYIQRARVDANNPDGKNTEIVKDDIRIATLNEMMRECGKATKDSKMARDIKTCGVGYRFIAPNRSRNKLSPYEIIVLNPMNTFCIYSNDVYARKLASVTYTVNLTNQNKTFGVYTDDYYFEFDTNEPSTGIRKTKNPLGINPIVEFINNDDRMCCFEKVLPLIDAYNIVMSDRVNDVSQQVQSILWLHNTKLDEDQKGKLVDGGVIQTQANQDGKDAKIQFVSAPLNQAEIQTLATSLEDRIMESAGVPRQGGKADNTTGEAQKIVTGWHMAEVQAKTSEALWRESEDETLEVCLAYIQSKNVKINGIDTLVLSDIDYEVHRSKNYDIASRVNSFVTLTNAGCDITKSALYCEITNDPLQFALDSEENMNKLRFGNNNEVPENKTVESIQPDTVLDK